MKVLICMQILHLSFHAKILKEWGGTMQLSLKSCTEMLFFTCPTALWGQDSYAVPLLMVMQKSSLCLSTILQHRLVNTACISNGQAKILYLYGIFGSHFGLHRISSGYHHTQNQFHFLKKSRPYIHFGTEQYQPDIDSMTSLIPICQKKISSTLKWQLRIHNLITCIPQIV